MKKVKFDDRQSGHRNKNHRGEQQQQQLQSQQQHHQRPMSGCFKTMPKLEIIMILVLIVLAHQIHGIHSQGKQQQCFSFIRTFIHYKIRADQSVGNA